MKYDYLEIGGHYAKSSLLIQCSKRSFTIFLAFLSNQTPSMLVPGMHVTGMAWRTGIQWHTGRTENSVKREGWS